MRDLKALLLEAEASSSFSRYTPLSFTVLP
jgi:hypothetical protein